MPISLRSLITCIVIYLGISCIAMGQRVIPDEQFLDYSAENLTLREVLFELSEKAEVTIAFEDQVIPGDSIVSLSIRRKRLGKIIDFLIEDHNLKYKIVGNQIVIVQDEYKKSTTSRSSKKSKDSKSSRDSKNTDSSLSSNSSSTSSSSQSTNNSSSSSSSSKSKGTISGIIVDSETGEPLVNANIYLYDYSQGVSSNEYGFYSFTLDKGLQRVYSSYIGYELEIQEISLTQDTTINIEMVPYTRLSQVIVETKALSPIKEKDQPEMASVDVLTIDMINSKLPLAGEPDVMRLAYAMTGVTTGADGFGGMSVRGGETNQNLVLFDGIPVYNAQHGFGLFSIFNSSVIKSAKLYKGAFPSRYSGRLSSVMDIRTREGSFRKFKGDVSIGLLTGEASFEGPIIKEKASFLVSARRTFVDPWIRSVTRAINDDQGSSSIYFIDLNGKLNFSIGNSSKVYLSYYTGNDNFDTDNVSPNEQSNFLTETDQLFWDSGNSLLSLRWNSRLSQKLFLNASAYRSRYSFISFDHDRVDEFDQVTGDSLVSTNYNAAYYRTQIKDIATKLDFDFIPNPKHHIKFGFGYTKHDFSPGFINVNQTDEIVPLTQQVDADILKDEIIETDLKSNESEIYIEDEIKLGQKVRLNLGYNHSVINTGNKSYHIPQPRMLFSIGDDKSIFKLSAGRMGQFLHTLTNTGLGVPIDVWLPSTDQIEPETSWIFSAGQYKQSKKLGRLGLEVFYKKYSNLTRLSENGFINISANSNWESLIPIGTGNSYGSEFSLNKQTSKTDISVAYTLSWSNRQYDDINGGETFAFRYDRRHVVNLSLTRKLGDNIDVSVAWEFGSGTPITLPENQAFIDTGQGGEEIVILIYSDINNAKLPAYHRLDFGVNIHSDHKWGKSKLTLGLYNAYNRQNPLFRDIEFNPNDTPSLAFRDLTILPILPTFRYGISF